MVRSIAGGTDLSSGARWGPLNVMDEAVVALANAAWYAGTAVGAAFAKAEGSLETPFAICGTCSGGGRLRDGRYAGQQCMGCGGKGFVTNSGEWVRPWRFRTTNPISGPGISLGAAIVPGVAWRPCGGRGR
jgi:hypothetical protein